MGNLFKNHFKFNFFQLNCKATLIKSKSVIMHLAYLDSETEL